MLSKISIAVDGDNQPVIRIDYRESEDVRDTLVKRFIETFGHRSIFATCVHMQPVNDAKDSVVVRPIQPGLLHGFKVEFDSIINEWDADFKLTTPRAKKK